MNKIASLLDSFAAFSSEKSGYTLGPLKYNFGHLAPLIEALGKIATGLGHILKGVK
ncbi:MAG: hypothetical protein Q3962_03860 [Corynebacterium sp.]|nr:hypothetical protein [Corynebacterium sp.]